VVPRDEVVISVDKNPVPKKKDKEDIVIELTQLDMGNDVTQIDTGVTSGADQSSWDPIDIDTKEPKDRCYGGEGSEQASRTLQLQPAEAARSRICLIG
jgi:hypothetical protein